MNPPLTTWAAVVEHLRRQFRLDRVEPGLVALSWSFTDGEQAVVHRQLVREGHSGGELFVVITAEVDASDTLSPIDALRHNGTMAAGALVLDEDQYVLRHGLPAAELSSTALDRALELVAHEAARLSHKLRCRVQPAFYQHYVD
jgi:hypothetical protein